MRLRISLRKKLLSAFMLTALVDAASGITQTRAGVQHLNHTAQSLQIIV